QWFSVSTPRAAQVACDGGVTVLASGRHERKLRRGQLAANAFAIRLRDVRGDDWGERLEMIGRRGVPNYFGPQRFGGDVGDNLVRAREWLPHRRRRSVSRFKQGLYLSVLRGFLFNEVLGRRVANHSWCNALPGDVAEERGPTGPLWGRGRSSTGDEAGEVEAAALAPHAELCEGLEYAGVRQQRRALALRPEGLEWEADAGDLQVRFRLPPGSYATSLLMEAFALESPA
ncbi:MAG: tRNA pseudouridine(13) synthase TruD, partial [Gammaproteobacteria bacterium]|nr:tRNA pseudouridine(13) synthase TruD [Gammaproteobacteria bacterium]